MSGFDPRVAELMPQISRALARGDREHAFALLRRVLPRDVARQALDGLAQTEAPCRQRGQSPGSGRRST